MNAAAGGMDLGNEPALKEHFEYRGKEPSAMSKEGSVAPKERVNITYKPATGNAKEEVELPLKLLMLGDYTLRPDPRPLEDRKPVSIDKDNFQKVMAEQKVALSFNV